MARIVVILTLANIAFFFPSACLPVPRNGWIHLFFHLHGNALASLVGLGPMANDKHSGSKAVVKETNETHPRKKGDWV